MKALVSIAVSVWLLRQLLAFARRLAVMHDYRGWDRDPTRPPPSTGRATAILHRIESLIA